jgi:hypothetical protein
MQQLPSSVLMELRYRLAPRQATPTACVARPILFSFWMVQFLCSAKAAGALVGLDTICAGK